MAQRQLGTAHSTAEMQRHAEVGRSRRWETEAGPRSRRGRCPRPTSRFDGPRRRGHRRNRVGAASGARRAVHDAAARVRDRAHTLTRGVQVPGRCGCGRLLPECASKPLCVPLPLRGGEPAYRAPRSVRARPQFDSRTAARPSLQCPSRTTSTPTYASSQPDRHLRRGHLGTLWTPLRGRHTRRSKPGVPHGCGAETDPSNLIRLAPA